MKRFLLASVALLLTIAPVLRAEDKAGHRLLVADDSKHRIAIVGPDGKIEWEHKVGSIHDLHYLPGGNILCQLSWTRIVELDPRTDMVAWEYDAAKSNGNSGKG